MLLAKLRIMMSLKKLLSFFRFVYTYGSSKWRKRHCQVFRARILMITITVVSIMVFINTSLLEGVFIYGGIKFCTTLPFVLNTVLILEKIDLIFNVITTHLMIAVMLILIGVRKCKPNINTQPAHWNLLANQRRTSTELEEWNYLRAECNLTHVTYFLTTVYILLTLPTNVIRVIHAFSYASFLLSDKGFMYLFQHIAQMLYYSVYATNLIVCVIYFFSYMTSIVGKIFQKERLHRPLVSLCKSEASSSEYNNRKTFEESTVTIV